jgi:HD superfamily phosphohydrolase
MIRRYKNKIVATLIFIFFTGCLAYYLPKLKNTVEPLVVKTIYGDFIVTEPVLLDLFKSPTMERIKHIRQYGVIDYVVKQPQEYTRYEHSVGVWALLRIFGASIEEQIAGLLHDASHTVFSHVGDILFRHQSMTSSYQDDIHEWYLKTQKIDELLARHKFSLESILHKSGKHTMLEQDLPEICADRFEYNLYAGILTAMLSKQDIQEIIKNTRFQDGRWFFVNKESAEKLARVSLYNTEHIWGGPYAYFIYRWTAAALAQGIQTGLFTTDDIHFSTDDALWGKLWISNDPIIIKNIKKIISYKDLIISANQQDSTSAVIKTKFRGINPWVFDGKEYKRLSEVDENFKKEYERVKEQVTNGWRIKLQGPGIDDNELQNLHPGVS